MDEILPECQENAKPFHEREIAEIITVVALKQPNLMRFQIFPNCFGPALALIKMIAATQGPKKPFFTSWEKHLVLATLKEPTVFQLLAPYVALSASGNLAEGFWDGKGRVIDTHALEMMRDLRDFTKGLSADCQPPPSSYFIEIFIAPYFDRLRHLLEAVN